MDNQLTSKGQVLESENSGQLVGKERIEQKAILETNEAAQKRSLNFKIRTTGNISNQELKQHKLTPPSQPRHQLPPKYPKLPALPPTGRHPVQQPPQHLSAKQPRIQRVRCGSRQKTVQSPAQTPPVKAVFLAAPIPAAVGHEQQAASGSPTEGQTQLAHAVKLAEGATEVFEPRVVALIRRLLPVRHPEVFLLAQPLPAFDSAQQTDSLTRDGVAAIAAGTTPKSLPPVKVQTYFSRGEFKLFKYLFHLGEWKRVAKPSLAEYLHYPRERDTDWLQAAQRVISNIPGIEIFCKKREHSWYANRLKQLHPDINWYYPDTFILPEEQQQYVEAHTSIKEDVYIAKMSGSRQGVGVRVLAKPSELSLLCGPQQKGFTTAVVQKYVNEPLLLKGIKSDLRLYLMITSVDPPIAFLNHEGLARFCTEPYVKPTLLNSNKLDPSSQLTNFTMNKGNRNFQATDEIEAENDATKRTLTSYWKNVKSNSNLDPEIISSRIEKLAQRLIKTMIPHLRISLEQQRSKLEPPLTSEMKMMHIIGLDVILDAEGHPWLLEVNSMPSMAIENSEIIHEEINKDLPIVTEIVDEPKVRGNNRQKGQLNEQKNISKKIGRSKTMNPLKQANKNVKTTPEPPTLPSLEILQKANLVDVFVKAQ